MLSCCRESSKLVGSRGPTNGVAKHVTMEVTKRKTVREDSVIAMLHELI